MIIHPPSLHRGSAFARFWAMLAVGALLACLGVMYPACTGANARRATVATIVTTGATTSVLFEAHLAVYRETAARSRARINADVQYATPAARLAAYDREMADVDRDFDERTRVLQTLSVVLYSAASIADAAGASPDGASSLATAAATTLEVLERTLAELREVNGRLGPVQIPPVVDATVTMLRGLARGVAPAIPSRTLTLTLDARSLTDAAQEP